MGPKERDMGDQVHAPKHSRRSGHQHYQRKSHKRWLRDMTSEDQENAAELCGNFMQKYGYPISGPPAEDVQIVAREESEAVALEDAESDDTTRQPRLRYCCNICGSKNEAVASELDRERRSCTGCGSSVRTRSIINLLSEVLFGESRILSDFPVMKDVTGIGLSDWGIYAKQLEKKLNYDNTFYHKEPYFDVTMPEESSYSNLDFMISSEVFEHVPGLAQHSFDGAFVALKEGGWLILTVPYMNRIEHTIEHFPELHEYEIEEVEGGGYVLKNTTSDGRQQVFDDLRFHGGPGKTLEMRIFSRDDLLSHLEQAGFSEIRIASEDTPEFGIIWNTEHSLPILCRK